MSEFDITSPAQGEAVVSTNGEVTISGVSSPDYEATIGYPVVIDVTVGSVQGSTTPDADGNWSVTLSGVSNGAHTVHARAHLELGNLATYELGVGTTDFTVVDADAGVPVIAPAIATTTALAGLVGFGVYALRRKQAVHTARERTSASDVQLRRSHRWRRRHARCHRRQRHTAATRAGSCRYRSGLVAHAAATMAQRAQPLTAPAMRGHAIG